MTVTSRLKVPRSSAPQAQGEDLPITCSVSMAASLFGMPDETFIKRFIYSGRIPFDRLHQISMRRVLKIGRDCGYLGSSLNPESKRKTDAQILTGRHK